MTEARLLRAPEIGRRLGVSRQYAARLLRSMPGARLAYFTLTMREVWVVEEHAFERWLANQRLPELTPSTGM